MSVELFGYLSDDDEEVKEYVDHSILNAMNTSDAKISARVLKTGDSMMGDLIMNNNLVKGLPTNYPPNYEGDEAVSWNQVRESIRNASRNECLSKSGDTMNGNLILRLNDDITRVFGVSDISTGKDVLLYLGNTSNYIAHRFNDPVPITSGYGTKFTSSAGTTSA